MSGHSHWATIRRKKGAVDAKRGRLFSKLAKAITIGARTGGGDPAMNLSLRYAVEKAKAANMPKDAIERAIKKGTGELGGQAIETLSYEGYGPGGVAIYVECLSDSRNRTSGEINHIFTSHGGSLGRPGCVAWMFHQKGIVVVPATAEAAVSVETTTPKTAGRPATASEERVMEVALDAGADDVTQTDDGFEVTCSPEDVEKVKSALEAAGIAVSSAEVTNVPQNYVPLGKEDAQKVLKLMEAIEENDDVQAVHANFDIPADILAEIQSE